MILALLACTEPGTLDSVAAALGERALVDGAPALQMMLATAGLLAETCGATDIDGYVFTSRAADALGAVRADVVRVADEGTQTWTFPGVGLTEDTGPLVVSTDVDAENLAIVWTGAEAVFTAGIELRDCDTTEPSVVVGGTGKWATATSETSLSVVGAPPVVGMLYAPPGGDAPSQGQLRATNEADSWVILLDDASGLGESPSEWPGVATGKSWETVVSVPWP